MLERKYDPSQPYRFVCYGRMSDPKRQNRRSPDQQFNTVEETRRRAGYPWQCVKKYRDDGISGRKISQRPGFQKMLRDIEIGLIRIDLIVVDTYERFGRAEELENIRHKLMTEHGILIVAADNGFADPTGVVGKAVGMVEQIRSTENTRITRHNVLRGKKDSVELGRWPGGPPPFGFSLKPMIDESGPMPKVYNLLDPQTKPIDALVLAFKRADETGEGDTRLAKWWNDNPEIPKEFKPISHTTIGYRLTNEIYIGKLKWGENRTGIVNDTRVIEKNPDGPKIAHNFCEAVIPVDLFERVQRVRNARSEKIINSRKHGEELSPEKLIAPQGRGLTLKYPLTGMIRCHCCKASMRPTPSGRKSKGGDRYVYYTCPRYLEGSCENGHGVSEEPLREAVFARLRARMFPVDAGDGALPWYPELVHLVRQDLQRFREQEPDRETATRQEIKELDRQLAGWGMTLGEPSLPTVVRNDIIVKYEQAKLRKQQLEDDAQAGHALHRYVEAMLDPRIVIGQLQKLGEILAAFNPTLVNLELSKHIEKIACFPDGKIEMRGTLLGLFDGAVDLLSRTGTEDVTLPPDMQAEEPSRFAAVVPRRRGRLYVPNLSADSSALVGDQNTSLEQDRFVGLPEPFFWKEVFILPKYMGWAEEHADEVARYRVAGETHEQLAARFSKTVPTIRKALRFAASKDDTVKQLPKKMPRGRWAEDHAVEVARIKTERGFNTLQLAEHFGKSDTTIRAALKHAERSAGADQRPWPDANDAPSKPDAA